MVPSFETIRERYPNVRESNAGLELLEEGVDGVYIGPKDYADEENDIHLTIDSTHLKIAGLSDGKKFTLPKQLSEFFLSNCVSLIDSMEKGNDVEYEAQLDKSSFVKVSTKTLPPDMCDMRVWYRNCIGELKPTRNGIRLHYLHVLNMMCVLKKESEGQY